MPFPLIASRSRRIGTHRLVVAIVVLLSPSLTFAQGPDVRPLHLGPVDAAWVARAAVKSRVTPTTRAHQTPNRTAVTFLEARAASEYSSRRRVDAKFWLLGAALNTAMVLDTMSTFDVLRRCSRCVESNPYVAPFIERGPAVAFTAAEGFDIGIMAIAAWMRGAQNPAMRTIWWSIPAALTAGHLMAYRRNLSVGR